MKRKRLALLLAAALTVTSVDGTAFAVSGADFSSEPAEEALSDETAELSDGSSEDEFSAEEEQQETLQPEGEASGETEEAAGNGDVTEPEELSPEEGLTSDDSAAAQAQTDSEVSEFSAGEEDAVAAEEEDGSASIIPDTLTELTVDQDYDVEITEDSTDAWFSFTPQEDGTYSFISTNEVDCDPIAYVYDKEKNEVTNKYSDYLKCDDDGNSGLNFRLTVNMKGNTTYYFCAELRDSDATGNFTVRLEKQTVPSSVQINMDEVEQTEFMSDIDDNTYLPGLTLTVDYGEGTESQTITFLGSNSLEKDSYGNKFSYAYSNGTDSGYTYPGDTLSKGSWNVVIRCNNELIGTKNAVALQVKTLENLPALQTGTDNTIESPFVLRSWYTFTAPETAKYTISPVSNISIYTQADKYYADYDVVDDKCVASLEAGKTYYIGFNGIRNIDGDEVNQWNVNIEKTADIASLEFSEKELAFTTVKDQLRNNTPVGTLTVNYNNGNSADSVQVPAYGDSSDRYGNRITAKLTDSDGNNVSWGSGEDLPVGNYTLSYSVGDIKTADISLTVQKATFNDFSKIVLGKKNQVKTSTYDEPDPYYYGFEAEKAGVYSFDCESEYDWNYLEETWYRFTDDGDIEQFTPERKPGGLGLDKGQYLVSWLNTEYGSSATIIAKYVPAISSVEVKSWKGYDSTVTEKTGNAALKELTAEVTYEDGTTDELKFNADDGEIPTDAYGRELSYSFYSLDKDGNYGEIEDTGDLKAGDYVYRVEVGGVYAKDISFKVLSRDDSVNKELTTGTSELENQTNLLLKYKAPADGRYELAVNIPVKELQIQKSDETNLEYISVTDYRTCATFEKDETYYIYVRANEYCPELKVTVSALTRPESMETTALKKNYIAGLDYFQDDEVQTKVNFGDQKSRTVKGINVVEGYVLQYKVKNSEGEEYDGSGPLTEGTWTVTPYLGASVQTGSAVAVEMENIPVKSDTITAKKLDLNALPKLSTDSWTEVANTMHNKKYYAFTAPEDGTYEAQKDSEQGEGSAVFYSVGEERYNREGTQITLKKGETCFAEISTLSDLKFKVVNVAGSSTVTPDPSETPEAVTEIALTDGMKKNVSYTGKDIKCTFTPTEDGCYVLESSSWNNEYADTYAELYCDNKWVREDDDNGEDNNFKLIWKLEKGKTYTYLVKKLDEEPGNFCLSFRKQKSAEIKDIEIVPKSEEEARIDSVLTAVRDSYDLKFTYADGTSQIRGMWSDTDDYGGNVGVDVDTEDSPFGESVTFKITVIYRLPWDDENVFKKELTVKKKGLATFKHMEVEKDYPMDVNGADYCFTPSEDGKYIITTKDQNGSFNYLEVEMIGESLSNGYLDTSNVYREQEGKNVYAVTLKAGKTYKIYAANGQEGTGSIRIQKVKKTLKGLELVKAPEQTTCLPNDVNYVSLKGLQVKALYTDGSTETISYGEADSSGRQIYRSSTKWKADGNCTIYVNLENYQVGFDLKPASWDDVQEMKVGKKISLNAESGEKIILKFVPEYTGRYRVDVNNGYVDRNIKGANPEDNCNYWNFCQLTAGKTYYFHIAVLGNNSEVTMQYECTDHKWDDGEVTKEPTCKEEGEKTYTCSVCGETKTESIPKTTDHKWDAGKVTKAATCKEEGEKTYTCSVCGATKTESIAKTTDHKWDGGKVTKAATCKEAGVKTYTCSVCGATKTETIAKTTDHKWDAGKVTKAATCKETGVKTYTCSVCGATKTETIAKTTNHKWDAGKVTKAATCKETGVKTYTCSVCGATKTESIAKTTDHKWDGGKVTKAATCKETGVKTYTCSVCGATKTETIAKTTDHKWDGGKVTKAATCKEEGVKTYTCSICGATKTETIAKTTDHKWDAGKVTKAATCKEEGVKTYTCSVCGATKTETIAKITDHKWDNGKVTKAATCKEEGVKTYTCSVCGATKTETIAKTDHKWSSWKKITDATIKAKEKQKRTCSVCKSSEYRTVGKTLTPTIKLNVTSITLQQKQSTKSVKVTMAKGDSIKYWTSYNKSVATVDKNGLIRAQKKNGTAKITVTLASNKKATVTVKVQSKKITTSKITGLKSSISIVRGNRYTLRPVLNPITSQDRITYSTSNKSIATVDSKGVITGRKAGTAKITVSAGSKKAVVTVKVTPKVKTTALSGVPTAKTVSRGKTFTIKAVAAPKNTEEGITYKSSNSKIATVTSKGVVKGIKKGTVTITVQSGSQKRTCKVTVK